MITKLQQILDEAVARGRKRLAVAYACDPHTLTAVDDAVRAGLVTPILFGPEDETLRLCSDLGIDTSLFTFVDSKGDAECVALAVKRVAEGEADILMKGLVPTDKYMRGILNRDAGLFPPKGTLSHVTVCEIPGYHKLLCISDVAVIPQPDFKQKTILIKYLTGVANKLGIAEPKVACIAPSEQVLPSVLSSTEAAILAKMGDRGQLGRAIVDGPLSLDVALFPEVVKEKKVSGSDVAGDADCLLFPNLESANVFFKAATHFGGATMAALVMGTNVPCVLTSRGDTPLTKLYSIALASLLAK
ncbi:MAG: phosphate acyltransferase [Muribaculaceae bacterium]